MQPTKYREVNDLISKLQAGMQGILRDNLIGTYLYGSLASGDFDLEISDIDLLALTTSLLNGTEFASLDQMQGMISDANEQWRNRIEIAYVPLAAIKAFRSEKNAIAVISPGEPFHFKEAGRDWLINWYLVQERGVIIYGPDPRSLIPHISRDEFLQGVRDQALEWQTYVENTRHSLPYQGHAVLTLCRALYAVKNGEQVSKLQAANWVKKEFPEWADLIDRALSWRADSTNKALNAEETFAETSRFVYTIASKVDQRPRVHS